MFEYACMLRKGEGRPQNLEAARDWYGRAAEKGNAKAMYNYALML